MNLLININQFLNGKAVEWERHLKDNLKSGGA